MTFTSELQMNADADLIFPLFALILAFEGVDLGFGDLYIYQLIGKVAVLGGIEEDFEVGAGSAGADTGFRFFYQHVLDGVEQGGVFGC